MNEHNVREIYYALLKIGYTGSTEEGHPVLRHRAATSNRWIYDYETKEWYFVSQYWDKTVGFDDSYSTKILF